MVEEWDPDARRKEWTRQKLKPVSVYWGWLDNICLPETKTLVVARAVQFGTAVQRVQGNLV